MRATIIEVKQQPCPEVRDAFESRELNWTEIEVLELEKRDRLAEEIRFREKSLYIALGLLVFWCICGGIAVQKC